MCLHSSSDRFHTPLLLAVTFYEFFTQNSGALYRTVNKGQAINLCGRNEEKEKKFKNTILSMLLNRYLSRSDSLPKL